LASAVLGTAEVAKQNAARKSNVRMRRSFE
jgi:hypothetical protein